HASTHHHYRCYGNTTRPPLNRRADAPPGLRKRCLFILNGSQASRWGEEGAGCGLCPQPAPSSPCERLWREQSERAATLAKPCAPSFPCERAGARPRRNSTKTTPERGATEWNSSPHIQRSRSCTGRTSASTRSSKLWVSGTNQSQMLISVAEWTRLTRRSCPAQDDFRPLSDHHVAR